MNHVQAFINASILIENNEKGTDRKAWDRVAEEKVDKFWGMESSAPAIICIMGKKTQLMPKKTMLENVFSQVFIVPYEQAWRLWQ